MKYNLTDTAIRNAKPQPNGNPKKYTDGGGLYYWLMLGVNIGVISTA